MLGINESEETQADRIEGELRATFSSLEASHDMVRLELAFSVAKALLAHVYAKNQPAEVLEFCETYAEILKEQAHMISEILESERKLKLN